MNRKTRSFIKKKLRLASLANPARTQAKNRSKIDKALFKCENSSCSTAIYEGTSDKNLKVLSAKFPKLNIEKGKIEADHTTPVREGKGEFDWNDYIDSLFCDIDNYTMLCPKCHSIKSKKDRDGSSSKKV